MKKRTHKTAGVLKTLCLAVIFSFAITAGAYAEEGEEDITPQAEDVTVLSNDEDTAKDPVVNLEDSYKIVFTADDTSFPYTGKEIKPDIKVVGKANLDTLSDEYYDVTYKNNINPGEAAVTVTGKTDKNYSGTLTAKFVIEQPKNINGLKVSLASSSYVYNGKDCKPAVTVKDGNASLKLNQDYMVQYQNCREVGTAKAVVTGKGAYQGSVTLTYKITFGNISSVKTSSAYSKIKVSWKAVTGANGYVVYRSTSSGSGYKAVKTITNGKTVSYTDTSVKFNKTYYYKVRAYRTVSGKKVYSAYTKVLKQKVQVSAPAITKVSSASYNSLKITWKKVTGANGYAVYRSTSANGKYTRIGTVKAKKKASYSYTDKKRTCGKTYYYKVKAYRKSGGANQYGAASAAKSGYSVPAKTNISKNSERYTTKVLLKWKKSSGASGYEIYRSTSSKGKYTRIKTITKGSTVRWTDSGLKNGKVYYYKIRPYRTVNGKKIYGSYSSAYKKDKGGWKYKNGYKLYYNEKGKLVKDVHSIIGKQSSYVIKVNKKRNVVTVYAKDGDKGYIIPVKAFVCSVGQATPSGTYKTQAKYRWHELMGPSWGQWNTRIVGGILFHSVYYNSRNNKMSLSVNAYNKLGTTCSHGCVRLKAGDAKWIYDNCKLKTKVVLYSSSDAGPFGRPSSYKLKSWHTWDPTDPTSKYKCKSRGCH